MFSREYLDRLAAETTFRPDTLEKVLRLERLLNQVHRHPFATASEARRPDSRPRWAVAAVGSAYGTRFSPRRSSAAEAARQYPYPSGKQPRSATRSRLSTGELPFRPLPHPRPLDQRAAKARDRAFLGEVRPMLAPGVEYDPPAALDLVRRDFIERLPGEGWRGR